MNDLRKIKWMQEREIFKVNIIIHFHMIFEME